MNHISRTFCLVWLLAALAAGCGESKTDPPAPSVQVPALEPAPGTFVRLTQAQYLSAVTQLLGDGLRLPVRLEPDARSSGFIAVGAATTTISGRGVEQYESAAYDLAEQVVSDPNRVKVLLPCDTRDLACATTFVETFGRRAWRRPLTADEVSRLVALHTQAADTLGGFEQGLQYVLAAILQSPNFLFRVELGTGSDARRPLDGYELATRLSFFLWNTIPDDALLDAAASGELVTDEGLEAQFQRMIEAPQARTGVRQFFSDLYELDRLDGVTKAPELFPHISEDFGPSAREETLRVIEALVFEDEDFRDVLTTRKTFLNRKLAAVYDVPTPAREGFGAYEFPESSLRRGILGHSSFLALWAHPVSTSATLRGMFIQQKLLCRTIPPPPAGVDTSIPEPSGTTPTLRDRIAEHLEEPACAGCHQITDPTGLAFENFDGIGRYRKSDNGAPLDTSGVLDGEAFTGPVELAAHLRDNPEFGNCLSRRLVNYATSHGEYFGESTDIVALGDAFKASDYRVLALVKLVVMSDAFRLAGVPE
ncbi:MAG: DUF1592 domain-containing protein [bacterium]